MGKWILFFCAFLYLSTLDGYAQLSDSLRLEKQLHALKELSHRNYDSTIIVSQKLGEEARKLQLKGIEWESMFYLADAYGEISNNDSAFAIINRLLARAVSNKNRVDEIKARTKLGELYQNNYQLEKSIENLVAAEKLLKDSDSFDLRFSIMLFLAVTHRKMKDYNTATKTLQSLVDDYYYQLDTFQRFNAYNNLGVVYATQKQYENAEKYFNQAFETIKEVADPEKKARITYNLGAIYVRLKEYDKAQEYVYKALGEYQKMNDRSGVEYAYRTLAAMQMDLEHYEEAEELSFKALKIAREIGSQRKVLGNYRNLYLIYGHLNEGTDDLQMLGKELEYFRNWAFLKDSIYQTEMTDKILELEKQYETEKKNNQITLLEKDNQIKEDEIKIQQTQRNSLLIFVVLVLVALGFFIYAFNRNRKLNRLLQAQSKRIIAQNELIFNQNKKLQKAIETRNKLFSIIAHDLRSPLASIANFSRLIGFYLHNNDVKALEDVAKDLNKKNNYVLELTDNLLSWAESQSEKLEPQFEKVSIKEIVEECLDVYSTVSRDKNIDLVFSEQDDYLLWADRNMVKTIMRNLINNGIKFTPDSGNVTISYNQTDGQVRVSVVDNGIGMSAEQASVLFDSNQREIRKGTKGEKSTGLGLSVCQQFAKAMHGSISAECADTVGCKFIVTLPAFTETEKKKDGQQQLIPHFSNFAN